MRVHTILFGLWAGAAMALAANAESPKVRTMSLDDCIQSALLHNLDLQMERLNPESYRNALAMAYSSPSGGASYDPSFSVRGYHSFSISPGSLDPSTRLSLPSSSLDGNTYQTSLGGLLPTGTRYTLSGNISESYGSRSGSATASTSGGANVSLTQPLLKDFWIDNTRKTILVSKKQLQGSELTLRYRIMQTITLVEQGYYDLISARENVKVQEKALELAQRLLTENRKKVEVGAMAPLDEKQAESRVATTKASLLLTRQTLATTQNTLKKLVYDNFSEWSDVGLEPTASLSATPQAFSLQDSWHKGMTLRPDLRQSRLAIEQQDIEIRYSKNQLFPELDLIGSYGHSGANTLMRDYGGVLGQLEEGRSPSYTYGAVLSVPLSNRSARYSLKNNKLAKQKFLLTLKQVEQDILVQIDDAVKNAQTALERVESTKQARLYAEAALDAEQKKLENGKSTSFFVLQFQSDLTTARSSEIGALADYNKALAALAQAEGATLDRHQINVSIK